jgi:acid phosphatase
MVRSTGSLSAGIAVIALVFSGSCGGATSKPPATTPQSQTARPAVDRHTHENLNAVVWMQTAVEYQASARQAYHAARASLDTALADPKWTAATEQTGDVSSLPPAVILDLDETVLDNSPFQARLAADTTPEKPLSYEESAWRRWVAERKATAIPGAVEFLKYAVSRGVTPIYVSNRNVKDADNRDLGEVATRDVLKKLGVPVEERSDTVLLRGENGWESSDKGPRRTFVAKSYRILLLVGDNFEDFVSVTDKSIGGRDALAAKYSDWWGARWIVLPNPTYGSWGQAVTLGAPQGSDAAALARKFAALKLAR